MIAFSTTNVLEAGSSSVEGYNDVDGPDFVLSVKYGGGRCVSKVLVTSFGVPRQLTVIMVLGGQADIVAVPELYSSAYVPWHSASACRISETAQAFLNAGLCERSASCVAIAVDIIYDAIDRDFIDYSGILRDCIFTSSGMMELNADCKERVFWNDHVFSNFPCVNEDEIPF